MKRFILSLALLLAAMQSAYAWSALQWTSNPSSSDHATNYFIQAHGTSSSNVYQEVWLYKGGSFLGSNSTNGTSVYMGSTENDSGAQSINFTADYYNGWDDSYTIYHTISINAPPDIATTFSFSNLSHTYDGNAKAASVTPNPGNANYSSDLTKGPGVGSYAVSATANSGYTGSGSDTLYINAASVSFSLSATSFTYNGSAQGPSVVPSPGGATYSTGGTLSATSPGNYTATASAYGNYSGSNNSLNWSINQAGQASVSITSASSVTFGTAYTATATGGSGTGALVWALGTGSTASGAAINSSSGVITANSAGTVVIKVQRAASANYSASAWTGNFTVTVNQATPTGTFGNRSLYALTTAGYTVLAGDLNASFSLSGAPAQPTGAITYSIVGPGTAVTAGSVLTCPATGSTGYTIRASYPGDANYNATTKDATWTVSYDYDSDGVPDYVEAQLGTSSTTAKQTDSSNATGLKVHKPNQ